MEEMWVQLRDFSEYSVSSFGNVRNDARGRLVRPSHTRQGAVKVGLVRGGKQHTRSVRVLVADAFLEKENELFDTPINLDGDPDNNSIYNLVWRPRWFAWKYHRQFEDIDSYLGVGPLSNRNTGVIYGDIVEAALTDGLLFNEVRMSAVNKIPVFPTWHIFDWI